MRAAVLSDVHGNAVALQAVVKEAESAGVEAFWLVGDLVANGPQPSETLALMRSLPGLVAVRGNTDRYVLTGDLAGMTATTARTSTEGESAAHTAARSAHAWTRERLVAAGHLDWLAGLPIEERMQLPDGTRVLLVHASPGRDDGRGVGTAMTSAELAEQGWDRCGAELAFVGHTHQATTRSIGDVTIVNLGSVSLPSQQRGATWTLLDANTSGYTIERRETPYDLDAVRSALLSSSHPSIPWLAAKLHLD